MAASICRRGTASAKRVCTWIFYLRFPSLPAPGVLDDIPDIGRFLTRRGRSAKIRTSLTNLPGFYLPKAISNLFRSLPVGCIRFSRIWRLILIDESGFLTSWAIRRELAHRRNFCSHKTLSRFLSSVMSAGRSRNGRSLDGPVEMRSVLFDPSLALTSIS